MYTGINDASYQYTQINNYIFPTIGIYNITISGKDIDSTLYCIHNSIVYTAKIYILYYYICFHTNKRHSELSIIHYIFFTLHDSMLYHTMIYFY